MSFFADGSYVRPAIANALLYSGSPNSREAAATLVSTFFDLILPIHQSDEKRTNAGKNRVTWNWTTGHISIPSASAAEQDLCKK